MSTTYIVAYIMRARRGPDDNLDNGRGDAAWPTPHSYDGNGPHGPGPIIWDYVKEHRVLIGLDGSCDECDGRDKVSIFSPYKAFLGQNLETSSHPLPESLSPFSLKRLAKAGLLLPRLSP